MTDPAIRALYVLPRAESSTEAALLWHLLVHLPASAVEPAVCFLEEGRLVARWTGELGIHARALAPAGRPGGTHAARAVGEMIRALGVQLLHAIGPAAQIVAGLAARRTRLPAVWTQPGVPTWGRAVEVRAALRPARAVIVHSLVSEHAQRRINPRRLAARRIAPGVTLPFRLPEHRRAEARAALGLTGEGLVVTSVGAQEIVGGHGPFLKAGASLCRARAHTRLLVVARTDADFAGQVERAADHLRLKGKVTAVDSEDVLRAIDASDIVVHGGGDPAQLPVALLQAMAAGATLVVRDQPQARELVTPGTNALLTPPEDDEALAVVLLALADDPALRGRLAAAAATAAREHYDADAMAGAVTKLYRQLLRA